MLKRVVFALVLFSATAATAELQNVTVGGSIEIYGAWYSDIYDSSDERDMHIRIPDFYLPKRPIGPFGTESWFASDGRGHNFDFVEQRTRLNVHADLTDNVNAHVEFDQADAWGSRDFRSDYRTGMDFAADSSDDIEVFQSYIEASDLGALPLTLRIGRQAITFGSGWLVGENPIPDPLTGLSFDAIRATWNPGNLTLDAWWSKLVETGAREEDGDVDFGGVYASYAWTEDIVFDLYWMLLRDARSLNDTSATWQTEWIEDWVGYDDYDVTTLHTVGLRSAGVFRGFDWEAEISYQFGNADAAGVLFAPGAYGDDGAVWDEWGGQVEAGYTFDSSWAPRVFMHGIYLGGEDKRSLSFGQWVNPFHMPKASVSFNRLFSDVEHDSFFDASAFSNCWEWCIGVSATPAEPVEVWLTAQYLEALEGFERPVTLRLGEWGVPLMPSWSFWTEPGAKDLGWEVTVGACYTYSEELTFEAGYTHLFAGQGLEDGAFVDENGLRFVGGRDHEDADILYGYTKIEF